MSAALAAVLLSGCDERPQPGEKEPIDPKVERLEKQVDELRGAVSRSIAAHEPDTGLDVGRPSAESE